MSDETDIEAAEERHDDDMKIIGRHVAALMEHFDTVQVFCTRHNNADENKTAANKGDGNWFARYGQVKEWFVKQEQGMRNECE